MLKNIFLPAILAMFFFSANAETKTYTNLSTRLVKAMRHEKDYSKMLDSLENVPLETLHKELDNDKARKAFWINIYNAHIQIFLVKDPSLFDDRPSFFKEPRIKVAGKTLSFQQIEHGIIRGSKASLGLGILPKLFPGKFERRFRVQKTDPRIHFALNCGAKSCPPVALYDYDKLDAQLDKSTKMLLKKTTKFNEEKNTVEVIAFFSWFRGDWGSKGKVRKFLKKYQAIPEGSKPSIKYAMYDWTLLTGNYIDL